MKTKILKKILILWILSSATFLNAQDNNYSLESWFQPFFSFRVADKWSIVGDFPYRRRGDFFDNYFQSLNRVGLTYHIGKYTIVAGFVLGETNYIREYRPYQRLTYVHNIQKTEIQHRLRIEQRWIEAENGFRFTFRTGYQLNIQLPLIGEKIKAKTPFIYVQDEIFVNFGKNEISLDQNRFHTGFGYVFSDIIRVQLGYQYGYVPQASIHHIHSIRLNLMFSFDCRKKEKF
jgi:hypothetical protein